VTASDIAHLAGTILAGRGAIAATRANCHQLSTGMSVVMVEDNDSLIVKECLEGSERAFEMLVDKYQRVVFNVAYRMTNDYDASEDIAQAVFIKVFENLRSFDPKYKLFSWLYRMTINESLNHIKHARRNEELSPTLASTEKAPDQSYGEAELRLRVQDCLMDLPPDHRLLIVMRHYGNRSYKEIAETVGISEKKVKSRLFTARHLLRDALAKRGVL
jgi:RNA polymerase sigma-70 factor, ECF subfamily